MAFFIPPLPFELKIPSKALTTEGHGRNPASGYWFFVLAKGRELRANSFLSFPDKCVKDALSFESQAKIEVYGAGVGLGHGQREQGKLSLTKVVGTALQ